MNPPTIDSERLTFLRALDDADGIEVSDWEAQFIESALKYQTGAILFSDRQREVMDRMWCRYGQRVQSPSASAGLRRDEKSKVQSLNLPETLPGKCAWLLKRDGESRQTRCGLEVGAGGIFCREHEAERARVKERMRELNRRRH